MTFSIAAKSAGKSSGEAHPSRKLLLSSYSSNSYNIVYFPWQCFFRLSCNDLFGFCKVGIIGCISDIYL